MAGSRVLAAGETVHDAALMRKASRHWWEAKM